MKNPTFCTDTQFKLTFKIWIPDYGLMNRLLLFYAFENKGTKKVKEKNEGTKKVKKKKNWIVTRFLRHSWFVSLLIQLL